MPAKWKPHFFLVIVNLIYGANYAIAKIALPDYIGPFAFILLRVALGAALFSLAHRFFIRESVEKKDLPLLAICGLFGVAINQLMFFKGLAITTEIHASMIMITIPITTLIASRLLLGDKITLRKAVGVGIGAAGVVWLILQANPGNPASASTKTASIGGDIMVLINAASYGLYLVLVKPLMRKYHPITIVRWVFLFGFIYVLPFGWQSIQTVNWETFSSVVWFSVLYVVLGATFVAYLFNAMALRTASPSLVGTYVYTQPLIAGFIAVAIGTDVITIEKIGASLLILTGVYLVSSQASYGSKNSQVSHGLNE